MTMSTTHETFSERFPGFEFDWFAQDAEGNIALFSTGGFGPVPSTVQAHFQGHDSAVSSIDVPHWALSPSGKTMPDRGCMFSIGSPMWGLIDRWNSPKAKYQPPYNTSCFKLRVYHCSTGSSGLPIALRWGKTTK